MRSHLFHQTYLALKFSMGCIALLLSLPVLGAWRNVCPEVEVCTLVPTRVDDGFRYVNPQTIPPMSFGSSVSVTLGPHGYFPTLPIGFANNPVARAKTLLVERDTAIIPEWNSAAYMGPNLLRGDGTILLFDVIMAAILRSDGAMVSHTSFLGDQVGESLYASLVIPPVRIGNALFVHKLPGGFTFRTLDEGLTWTSKSAPGPVGMSKLLLYPYGPGLWAIGREGGQYLSGLYQSLDEGASWQRVDDQSGASNTLWGLGASLADLAVDPRALASGSGTVYAASNKGVLVSRDRGLHWELLHALDTGATTVALAYQGATTVLVAGTANGVIASRDGGATWFDFSRGLYGLPHHVYFVNGLLLAGSDAGWYICDDLDCGGAASFMPAPAARGEVPVVEFYHAGLDHYFITSDAAEAAGIDAGMAGAGWARTGYSFTVWTPLGNPMAKDVCRFYGSPSPGPNSHFFSMSAWECEALHRLQKQTPASSPRWNFEAMVFQAEPVDPATSACREGKRPVYRAYNNGFARGVDSNHRFVTDPAQITALVARGWKDEGIAFCAKGV